MWSIELPHWWDFVIRAIVVYVFLLVLLRLTGKRQVGQLAPFDLVLLLVLSNAVQNSMNGGDNSITGGLISAATLVAVNYGVGWLTFKNKHLEALIEGRPVILIHDGQVHRDAMAAVKLTTHELNASLRSAGCVGPEDVRFAVLENNGQITVIPWDKPGAAKNGGDAASCPEPPASPPEAPVRPASPPEAPGSAGGVAT